MYTVPTMHAILTVLCWINMRPLNRTQTTNLQLHSNQLTNYNPCFGVRGEPQKILLPWVPISVDRSMAMRRHSSTVTEIYKHGRLKQD